MTETKHSLALKVLDIFSEANGDEPHSTMAELTKSRGARIWAATCLLYLPDDVALPQIVEPPSMSRQDVALRWERHEAVFSSVTLIFESAVKYYLAHIAGTALATHKISDLHKVLRDAGFGLGHTHHAMLPGSERMPGVRALEL